MAVVQLGIPNNLLDFFFSHFFAHVYHSVKKLLDSDFAVMISIKHLERIDHVLQRVGVLSPLAHQVLELLEVELAAARRVHFLHQIL